MLPIKYEGKGLFFAWLRTYRESVLVVVVVLETVTLGQHLQLACDVTAATNIGKLWRRRKHHVFERWFKVDRRVCVNISSPCLPVCSWTPQRRTWSGPHRHSETLWTASQRVWLHCLLCGSLGKTERELNSTVTCAHTGIYISALIKQRCSIDSRSPNIQTGSNRILVLCLHEQSGLSAE